MKSLPEHKPRENSWEKIMEKKDFDFQLNENLKKLPVHVPSDLVWERIEKELESQRRIFPWKAFSIAASFVAFLLLALYLSKQDARMEDPPKSISQVTSENLLLENTNDQFTKSDSLASIPLDSQNLELQKKGNRIMKRMPESLPVISSRPSISMNNQAIVKGLDLGSRENHSINPADREETYHSVAISWGLNRKKILMKTNFGVQDPAVLISTTNEKSELQARIKLKRKKQ
ncbi:hypothetical protein Aoki45_18870 [Algoriphagus sp. oki45]|uniref:hypothetical protein n=1 Tax=Algoriphagus sp. oki45 TaxID=3067294 RepID=UPI0027FE0A1A|nr:hypothetical protein Aoki45_18870 [Algoriphagus sp. oki45]